MGITVAELLEIPHLRLRLHSGGSGLHRELSWTHTSDLPQPWEWVTGGELLMTNGMSFPRRAAEQEDLVVRLVGAGASALAIGEQMYCPPLTRAFARASDRLEFPVMWVHYPLPFVAISRAVAEATLIEQSQRVMKTARIYDAVRREAARGADPSHLVEAFAEEFGCDVHLCHRQSGTPWYPRSRPIEPTVEQAVASAPTTPHQVTVGAFATPLEDGREVLQVQVPGHDQAVLVFVRDRHVPLDAILIQHAATVAAMELSQTRLALEHDRHFGAELLAQLLDNSIDASSGRRQLAARQLEPSTAILIAARGGDDDRMRELHVALWRHDIPHLCMHRPGLVHALLPDQSDIDGMVTQALGPAARVGASRPVKRVTRLADAAREATWALAIAERTESTVARYGEAAPWVGLSNIAEAQALVERVLRPLLDYESEHRTGLIDTLEGFLSNQRSWQRTAAAMHVHRQTVLYRIRKIEELTSRDLSETSDIAELWLALRAFDLVRPHT